jgi:hypothetical protein
VFGCTELKGEQTHIFGISLELEGQNDYRAADFGVLGVERPGHVDAVEDADSHRLDKVLADSLSVDGPLAVGLVAQHLNHLCLSASVAQLLVGVVPVVARGHAQIHFGLLHSQSEKPANKISVQKVKIRSEDVYLLQWKKCSPGPTVRILRPLWSALFRAGPTSALWNIRSPSWLRKVMLTLTASPAPQPVSRRICCASTNVSAASRALVKKWRAEGKLNIYLMCYLIAGKIWPN